LPSYRSPESQQLAGFGSGDDISEMDGAEPRRAQLGLVLAGGAARGAYQVGVLEHLVEEVSRDLGRDVPLDILCGTSVGAINCVALAAHADEPRGRVARLASVWSGLKITEMLRPSAAMDVVRAMLGRSTGIVSTALFDPGPLEQLLGHVVPYERIDGHLRAGRIAAVAVSTTQVSTGRTVVFVQRPRAQAEPWPTTPGVVPRAVRLRAIHSLASSAVPLLFPAVRIDGRYYCDGGLRQNVPISPARRLGATHLVVVNPKHRADQGEAADPAADHHVEAFPSALALLGKTLNALLLDRIDNELDRLEKINDVLDAGTRRYGPGFTTALNEELGYAAGRGLRALKTVHIRASENIARMCAEYVRSPDFVVPGMLGRAMKRLAETEATREADLLSYVLLDGEFCGRLMELGRSDARRHHAELCGVFDEVLASR
jgi:NTE family protein